MRLRAPIVTLCALILTAAACSGGRTEELITAPQAKKATASTTTSEPDPEPSVKAATATNTTTTTTVADGSTTSLSSTSTLRRTTPTTTVRRSTTTTRRVTSTTRKPSTSVAPSTTHIPSRDPATTTTAPRATTTSNPFILTPPSPTTTTTTTTTTTVPPSPVALSGPPVSATNSWATAAIFDCGYDEAAVSASGAARIVVGPATVYVGSFGGDPRVARFDNGAVTWCRSDIELSAADHRGHGLAWTGSELLALVSAPKPDGPAIEDIRYWAAGGWLDAYDAATTAEGQARVEALVGLNSLTGSPVNATFLTSLNAAGATDGLIIRTMNSTAAGLRLDITVSGFPRRSDRSAMACSSGAPYSGSYTITNNLSAVVETSFGACS